MRNVSANIYAYPYDPVIRIAMLAASSYGAYENKESQTRHSQPAFVKKTQPTNTASLTSQAMILIG